MTNLLPTLRKPPVRLSQHGPSPAFIAMTRNPSLLPPTKVERTHKAAGDVEILSEREMRRRGL